MRLSMPYIIAENCEENKNIGANYGKSYSLDMIGEKETVTPT
jgi:hypothetical protein